MQKRCACLIGILVVAGSLFAAGQVSTEEALARLKARQGRMTGATLPTSRAAETRPAATRPGSLKEAKRVVFLVDTRTVLLERMTQELRLAVEHLREDQLFTIVVARGAGLTPAEFRSTPVRASKGVREEGVEFIRGIVGEQKTAVVPAIRKAVALEPDFMWFVVGDGTPRTEQVRQAFLGFHGRLNVLYVRVLGAREDDLVRTLAVEHGGIAVDQLGKELPAAREVKRVAAQPETRPSVLER